MATARVFKDGPRQLVELPPEFRLSEGEVEVRIQGNELVLAGAIEDSGKPFGVQLIELIQSMPEDMFLNLRDERPPEKREGL